MALDKAILTEYDSIVLVDRSGSMGASTPRFPTRWAEAKEMTIGLANLAAETDEDGITLIAFGGQFNQSRDVTDGVKGDAVSALFDGQGPGGTTPTAEALQAAFAKKFSAGTKKAIIFVITDGEPNDKKAVETAIIEASKKLNDASEIRILFIQVGDDANAAKWLGDLDNNLTGAKFDIVNSINFNGANGLTSIELFDRALNDTH